jgi:hypothetical protein
MSDRRYVRFLFSRASLLVDPIPDLEYETQWPPLWIPEAVWHRLPPPLRRLAAVCIDRAQVSMMISWEDYKELREVHLFRLAMDID